MRLLVMLWLFCAASAAAAACQVTQSASVPVDTSTQNMIVHVTIDGASVPMILDTGAERSVLDTAAVDRLHLVRDEWVATTMRGVGGVERERNALPRSIILGGVALRTRSLAPGISLPVAHFTFGSVGGEPIAGLLGTDILAAFDLALDGPGRRLTLYSVRACSGRFLPWTRPYESIPTLRPVHDALLIPARIDRHVLLAQIDTGAAHSLLLAPGMTRLGLTGPMLADDQTVLTRGLGPGVLTVRRHMFQALTVGDETTADPLIGVADAWALRIVDLLLGADWLRTRVVWLSYSTNQVFLARP